MMSDNITGDLRKIMMAGVGAVAVAAEKSKQLIDDLAQKGENAYQDAQPTIDDLAQKGAVALEQGKVFGEEMKLKIKLAFENLKSEAQQLDLDEIGDSLNGLTDDALTALKQKLDEVIQKREHPPEDPDDEA